MIARLVKYIQMYFAYIARIGQEDITDLYFDFIEGRFMDEDELTTHSIYFGDYKGEIHQATVKIISIRKRLWYSSEGISLKILHITGLPLIEDCSFKQYRELYHDILTNEKHSIITNDDLRRYRQTWKNCQSTYPLHQLMN